MSTPFTPILRSMPPTVDAGPGALDDERGDAVVGRESAGPVLAKTQYQSAWRTPDIQHFVPGEDPVVAVGHGTGAHAHDVAAGLRLGEPEGGPLLAGGDRGDVALRAAPRFPAIITGPVGRRVRRSMSAAAFEYLATSSIARVSPRMPAPEPPRSSGMQRPVRPASTKSSKRSWGYSSVSSISRARGATRSRAQLADRRLQLRQLGRQLEIHRDPLRYSAVPGDRRHAG